METAERLRIELTKRSTELPPEIRRRLEMATDKVIFGSFALGLNSSSSDLDVFGIGESRTHYKTQNIEIMLLPEHDAFSSLWLESELACHIAAFGVALGRTPDWFLLARTGEGAILRKSRRIEAYLSALERHWSQLGSSVKSRYQKKLRRELQRLSLLKAGKPIPPTPLLDAEFSKSCWQELITASGINGDVRATILRLFPLTVEA